MTSISPDVARGRAPTGRLRATIYLGNMVLAHRASSGELGGVFVELARELSRRLGMETELYSFDTAGKAFAALAAGACDIGFLAIDPERAEERTTPRRSDYRSHLSRSGVITAPNGRGCR